MKKDLSFLVIVVLTICLVGFAFDRITPASPVHAASELHAVSTTRVSPVKEPVPLTRLAEPGVYVVIGLVGGLFGILAVSPLLIDDPDQVLREANRAD